MSEHSKLPFRAMRFSDHIQITTQDGIRKIAVTTWDNLSGEDNANFDLLVNCANAHEGLVQALQDMLTISQTAWGLINNNFESIKDESAKDVETELWREIQLARAVLAALTQSTGSEGEA